MKKITAKEMRDLWINFYKEKKHVDIGSASLISESDPSVLFVPAGMQPLVRYLLGEPHPSGSKRICNIQKCIRTGDIDEVGDNRHFTFFEQMGNWSLGDYWKEEQTAWTVEFLTKSLGLDLNKVIASVFAGDEYAPRDNELAEICLKNGISKKNIQFLDRSENWWGLGQDNTPCGPCNEWNYPAKNGEFVELGNNVYMEYVQRDGGKRFEKKQMKCIDLGWGLERNLAFINGVPSAYSTDLFEDALKYLEKLSGKTFNDFPEDEWTRSFRIVADHTRTAMAILGDQCAIVPSNTGAGYVLRRIIRKAIRHIRKLGIMQTGEVTKLAKIFVDNLCDSYPEFKANEKNIITELNKEEEKFLKTLESGEKEFNKLVERLQKFAPQIKTIAGKDAFRLFDTYGFPLEFTMELGREQGYDVDEKGFKEAFDRHQELARTANAGVFKGGLTEAGVETTNLHTATHLLNAALRKVLGPHVFQKGSNINSERLRFDFSHTDKMTDEQIAKAEKLVNEWIDKAIKVELKEMKIDDAKKSGAIGVFDSKYGDVVKVYKIGDASAELCGGPHAANTKDLGKFKIVKEEAVASGVRRIKATLEK